MMKNINKDFGYTRLEMKYKTCVRCRARTNLVVKHIPKNPLKKEKRIMKPIKKKRKNIINHTGRKMLTG